MQHDRADRDLRKPESEKDTALEYETAAGSVGRWLAARQARDPEQRRQQSQRDLRQRIAVMNGAMIVICKP